MCMSVNMVTSLSNLSCIHTNQLIILWPLFQENPDEQMLSQRTDLLEQPRDFYEPDVVPATRSVMSKHYRKT